ncbi:hypothetical protein PMAYCL1PPCAC_22889 [Pristionchus mayeri]|uniref:Uncharacterized protein n=1 Tax=Pristionchus mayeri TaxID=1317129 RepID=A0AAN5I5X1_9BILA|nr:hypothetical protein PMAYCL1PPCAC_22889 [Pristionchus mayeri]
MPVTSSSNATRQQKEQPQKSGIPSDQDTCLRDDATEAIEMTSDENFCEYPRWGSLPWPAFTRLCCHLRNHNDCADLANLAQVIYYFRIGVKEFMQRADNRPGIKFVRLLKTDDGITVFIHLYPSNIPFYCLTTLDKERYNRLSSTVLEITLEDHEDKNVNQLSDLFSSYIDHVHIYGGELTPAEYLLGSQILSNSTIVKLQIFDTRLDDDTAPHILSLVSRTKKTEVAFYETRLSDSATFINRLSTVSSSLSLIDISHRPVQIPWYFFGLRHSFWSVFLNEKLANGSLESIQTGNMKEKVTKAPFNLADTRIRFLEWNRKL